MIRTKEITYDITKSITNLKIGDKVVNLIDENFYTVEYIDLVQLNAVLSRNKSKGCLVMNLTSCQEFLIFY